MQSWLLWEQAASWAKSAPTAPGRTHGLSSSPFRMHREAEQGPPVLGLCCSQPSSSLLGTQRPYAEVKNFAAGPRPICSSGRGEESRAFPDGQKASL